MIGYPKILYDTYISLDRIRISIGCDMHISLDMIWFRIEYDRYDILR